MTSTVIARNDHYKVWQKMMNAEQSTPCELRQIADALKDVHLRDMIAANMIAGNNYVPVNDDPRSAERGEQLAEIMHCVLSPGDREEYNPPVRHQRIAQRALNVMSERHPNVTVTTLQAFNAFIRNEITESAEYIDRAIKQDPHDSFAHLLGELILTRVFEHTK